MSKQALGLIYTHENRALENVTNAYCAFFAQAGVPASVIDLAATDAASRLGALLASGQIAFSFGMQGVGSCLTRGDTNLWQAARVPFLGIHFDHPCYNPFNHFNDSRYVANIYHFASFLEAKQNYLPTPQMSILLPYEILGAPAASTIAFADRPIKLLFLKSGAPVDEFVDYFNALPGRIIDGVWAAIERTRLSPDLSLCDLVQEIFDSNGLDRARQERQFWGLVQAMDFYLRRKRAIDLVNWLKFQPGAVIVGDGWDFIDRTGARAEFRPSLPSADAVWLYEQAQFVCNTNPYGRDVVHERNIIGLARGCCVLSDTNAWWDAHFSDVQALTRFRWDTPLDSQLLPAIHDPKAQDYIAAGRAAALQRFTNLGYIQKILVFVAQVAASAQE